MNKVKEITFALSKSVPGAKQYESNKPLFSMTMVVGDEEDDASKAFGYAQRYVEGQMDLYLSAKRAEAMEDTPDQEGPPAHDERPMSPPAGMLVTKTTMKKSSTGGRPWTLYFIEFSDGTKVTTFDNAMAIKASEAKKKGVRVLPQLSMEGKYKRLDGITILDQGVEEPKEQEQEIPF